MTDPVQRGEKAAAIRRAAEARWAARASSAAPRSEVDLRRAQHELEVHQIELEMQNEELVTAHRETEDLLKRYTDLYDFAPTGYLTVARDDAVREVNLTATRLLGVDRARLVGRRFSSLFESAAREKLEGYWARVYGGRAQELVEVDFATKRLQIEAVAADDGQLCRVSLTDVTIRHRLTMEREGLIRELEGTVAEVKRLSGLLRICAHCKKINDRDLGWVQMERYVTEHSQAQFTHGICPACAEQLLTDFMDRKSKPPKP